MTQLITGIQQVGIGVSDCNEAKYFYRDVFGMDTLIFDDISTADLMTEYTGKKIHNRHAILTMNLSGGGGFELWQFTTRTPANYHARFGDIGIFSIKIKCQNVSAAQIHFKKTNRMWTSAIMQSPSGESNFWVKDIYGNFFNIAESKDWFKKNRGITGGVYGATIGVSDMDASVIFYKKLLGIDEVVYDLTGSFADDPHNSGEIFKRVLLRKRQSLTGAFTNLLGNVEIELVQLISKESKKIFQNRYWGDCGFIHLCFDVTNMNELKKLAKKLGYRFTVDSKESYGMERAAGRFCYVEDPDGTLIELVETHKIPILKKINWYLDLKKRKGQKPLPKWMINMLALNKVK
jgi:catechol 2,3-dioxygenase-like lactoylglutathione lyase family enzyme